MTDRSCEKSLSPTRPWLRQGLPPLAWEQLLWPALRECWPSLREPLCPICVNCAGCVQGVRCVSCSGLSSSGLCTTLSSRGQVMVGRLPPRPSELVLLFMALGHELDAAARLDAQTHKDPASIARADKNKRCAHCGGAWVSASLGVSVIGVPHQSHLASTISSRGCDRFNPSSLLFKSLPITAARKSSFLRMLSTWLLPGGRNPKRRSASWPLPFRASSRPSPACKSQSVSQVPEHPELTVA